MMTRCGVPPRRPHFSRPQAAPLQRACSVVSLIVLAGACSPRLLPLPATQKPTVIAETPSAVAIQAPAISNPGLVQLHMLDQNNGWGIGDKAIVRTADGALTWHNVSPTGAAAFGYSVTADFLDTLHAWVLIPEANDMLTGTLYRTPDGGVSWTKIQVPFSGGDLHFLDARQGWMMASLGAGAGSMGVAVFQSTDGGAFWTQTYTNDPNQTGAGNSLPLGGLKDGMAVLDMHRAWIGGVVYTPGLIYLYQTNDAGRTWQQSQVAPPPGYEQAELETTGPIFISSQIGYLPVHVSFQNGVMLAIYATRDAGNSWRLSPTLIPQGGAADFVSAQAGLVWNGTQFYGTSDAAQTWKTISPDVAFADTFAGMDFVSPTVGFVLKSDAAGTRSLYKTLDGGATWNRLSP